MEPQGYDKRHRHTPWRLLRPTRRVQTQNERGKHHSWSLKNRPTRSFLVGVLPIEPLRLRWSPRNTLLQYNSCTSRTEHSHPKTYLPKESKLVLRERNYQTLPLVAQNKKYINGCYRGSCSGKIGAPWSYFLGHRFLLRHCFGRQNRPAQSSNPRRSSKQAETTTILKARHISRIFHGERHCTQWQEERMRCYQMKHSIR